jgi:hypothetical protein
VSVRLWPEDPARYNPDRCRELVDGEPCGFFSIWDELYIHPELNQCRLERHAVHLSNVDDMLKLMSKVEATIRGAAKP